MRPIHFVLLLAPLALSAQQPTTLPVTHVSLYKNGVGFFEHTGNVTGNASVTIDFTTAQLNDVLQSLTALDLNGGRISGADYNSTTPLDQQLRSLSLGLPENTTYSGFLTAIRGSRVEITGSGAPFTGRLMDIETHKTILGKDAADTTETHFLSVVSDAGELRIFPMSPTLSVRLLDTALHADVNHYLELLDTTRNQGLRHLTLDDHGAGPRELHVSYISEVPIWKSTYRILFTDSTTTKNTATLQGWSVVDNTTGTDWLNVQLSLIAGSPQSFIQPLSQAIYSRRPEIAIAQEAQLTPQTHESGELIEAGQSGLRGTVTDPSGAIIPNANITVTNSFNGARATSKTANDGSFQIPLSPGQYTLQIDSPGFQTLVRRNLNIGTQSMASESFRLQVGSVSDTVEVNAMSALPMQTRNFASLRSGAMAAPKLPPPPPPSYEDIASNSLTPQATTAAFDDFFQYNLTEPVTIHKNESALVPILQAKVTADRVTLVTSNGSQITGQPLRALWLTNTTNLTLDRGSFSIVENGSFGGEGLLDPIHAGEKRLLSYASDQAIHVTTEGAGNNNTHVTSISVSKGVVHIMHTQIKQITYVIHNAAADPRTVVLEHPIEPGLTLDTTPAPEETTGTLYRWRIPVSAASTERLTVRGKANILDNYELEDTDADDFATIIVASGNNADLQTALAPILEARRRVADAQAAVDQTNAKLATLRANEDRQRANITALQNADRDSRTRFVNDLNKTEDAITATQFELDTRTATLETAQTTLSNQIEALQLTETL